MHYRIRGNNVQLVKTVVDKKTLKPQSAPVGSANLATGVLNDSALSALTPDEVAEVRTWIQDQQQLVVLRSELEARSLAKAIGDVGIWLKTADKKKAGEVVREVEYAFKTFRMRAHKLGLITK
jgi:hypothetical protein